ncbi:cyclophilin-like fold protein [Sporofaciens musculi]|nr:cyclophilin-like fold protein [Sporofaciens musculi]
MRANFLQLLFCVIVIAIFLFGCSGIENGSNTEAFIPPSSKATQAADNGHSSDMGSDTEDFVANNESTPNQTDNSPLDGEESSTLLNNSDSSNLSQPKMPEESNLSESQANDNSATEESIVEKMTLQIGNSSFTVTLESNAAVEALVDMMREAPVVIQMSDYSGFEKVGSLGTSLPTSNSQTTTKPGDIVLYNGNQIVIFYGSNSWSYTRLGKIDDLSGWEDALGSSDVTVTFSLG